MKKLICWIAGITTAVAIVTGIGSALSGCATQQDGLLSGLNKLGAAGDSLYQNYTLLVASGALPTNNLSSISEQYLLFRTALTAVQQLTATSTNTPPPQVQLSNSFNQLKLAIDAAKAKKK